MQKKGATYFDKGPGFALDESQPPKAVRRRMRPTDMVYVFCVEGVNAGDGNPIPPAQFVQVKAERLMRLRSSARQKGHHLVVLPLDWTPEELNL